MRYRAIEHGLGGRDHSLHVTAHSPEEAAREYLRNWDRTIIEDGFGSKKIRVYCKWGINLLGVFTVTASEGETDLEVS